jgi:hypothetical protein
MLSHQTDCTVCLDDLCLRARMLKNSIGNRNDDFYSVHLFCLFDVDFSIIIFISFVSSAPGSSQDLEPGVITRTYEFNELVNMFSNLQRYLK